MRTHWTPPLQHRSGNREILAALSARALSSCTSLSVSKLHSAGSTTTQTQAEICSSAARKQAAGDYDRFVQAVAAQVR
jgi:hypothetical protein